jgi:hypothetical protein
VSSVATPSKAMGFGGLAVLRRIYGVKLVDFLEAAGLD